MSDVRPDRGLSAPAAREPGLLKREAALMFGGGLCLLLILAALGAPLAASWLGHGPTQQFRSLGLDLMGLPIGPSRDFPFGADGFGRDVFVRTLYGLRVSLLVGIPATALALLIGVAIGLLSGWMEGWTDRLLAQLMDVVIAFPFILIALSLLTINRGADGRPILPPELLTILVIALFSWVYFARLTRSLVASLRRGPLVEAAQVSGASGGGVILREILPILTPKLAIFWAAQLPVAIVAEATLSFLGVGIAAPTPSLGNMISEAQRSGLYQIQPWLLLGPGGALFLVVAGANLLAAGLRSRLDPQGGAARS